jgi:hypothetical protein
MPMKRAFITALTSAVMFTGSAWSQDQITGIKETSLVGPSGNQWNQHPFAIYDSTGDTYNGKYLYYWSCGNGPQDGICVGTMTPGGAVSNVSQPISVSKTSTLCDMQDPGVVKFNGVYYLYAAGVRTTAECNDESNDNEHAAIYGWSSTDGLHFSPLNGGNPVIQFAIDTSNGVANAGGDPDPNFSAYAGHGINAPTPVVMAECSCIRIYYWYQAPGYGLISSGNGVEAQDSTDGTNFNNERVILTYGYWQQVKRTGLNGGDYPLVMTLDTGGNGFVTLTSSANSDQSWTCEFACAESTASNTAPNPYPPHLESDVTGLLLDSNLDPITIANLNNNKQLYLDWDNGILTSGNSFLYRGNTAGLSLFPDLAAVPSIIEFVPNGTGITQEFTIQAEDNIGGSGITYLQPFLSISSNMSTLTSSCHVLYASSNNTLYLDSSAGNFSWVGSQPSGGSWSGSNSNGICQVNYWSTSISGNYLTLSVNLTFQQNLTWYEFVSASNLAGSTPWLTNGLTWSY